MEVVDDVGEVAFGIEAVQAGGLNDRRERGVDPGAVDMHSLDRVNMD